MTIWSEGLDANLQPLAARCYPDDINSAIADFLRQDAELEVTCRDINMEENGLPQKVVDGTDVLLWWGHMFHDRVSDEVAQRVAQAVLKRGMGLLLLHASLNSKPASILLGRCGTGKYRECGERERVWVINPSHPIVEGLEEEWFDIPQSEMYGEPYVMPTPDDLIFISWFQGGEVLRSGAAWNRGSGRILFLAPGHEEFPVYTGCRPLQKVIANACRWLRPTRGPVPVRRGEVDALEPLPDVPLPERLIRSKGRVSKKQAPGSFQLDM